MKNIIILIMSVISLAKAAVVNVYFAGGQSNMVQNVSTSIQSAIREDQPGAVVIRQNWSGNPLYKWSLSGIRQSNYLSDLLQVQNTMATITASGDTPVFSGLFWFQGESDISGTSQSYITRFLDMIGFYTQDLGVTVPYSLALIDCNPSNQYYTSTIGANVDVMRETQKSLGELTDGSYFDTRGFIRVDLWHLKTTSQTAVGTGMGQAFVNKFIIPEVSTATMMITFATLGLLIRRR